MRSELVAEPALREALATHRLVSRGCELDGVSLSFLAAHPSDPVEPTLEDAFIGHGGTLQDPKAAWRDLAPTFLPESRYPDVPCRVLDPFAGPRHR